MVMPFCPQNSSIPVNLKLGKLHASFEEVVHSGDARKELRLITGRQITRTWISLVLVQGNMYVHVAPC